MNLYLHGTRASRFVRYEGRWASLAPWYWIAVNYLDTTLPIMNPVDIIGGLDPKLLKAIIHVMDK